MSTRVFVPMTMAALAEVVESGGVGPSPVHAHAVTDWLREAWPDGAEEEWEYAALMAAADDSTGALGPEDLPRRVVLVADVEQVTADRESTAVTVDAAISMRLVRAVHADTADVDPRDEDLPDLGWFATQEIADLLAD